FARDQFGDDGTMAGAMIALEAEQAGVGPQPFLPGPREFHLCPVGAHVLGEDRPHPLRVAGAHRLPAFLRGAETLEMEIADTPLGQSGGEQALGEAGLARGGDGAHVDQQRHARGTQGVEHGGDRRALVADRAQNRGGYHGYFTGSTPPPRARPFCTMHRRSTSASLKASLFWLSAMYGGTAVPAAISC